MFISEWYQWPCDLKWIDYSDLVESWHFIMKYCCPYSITARYSVSGALQECSFPINAHVIELCLCCKSRIHQCSIVSVPEKLLLLPRVPIVCMTILDGFL